MAFFNKFEGALKYKGVIIFLAICITILLIMLGVIYIAPRAGPDTTPSDLTVCDLNADMKCNFKDRRIFNFSMGICKGHKDYLYDGDFDRDGCVTTKDKEIFLNAF